MTPIEPLTSPLNELAKERTRAAAERTLSTWINNCLALIGVGVMLDQVYGDLEHLFPPKSLQRTAHLAHDIGLVFIGLGIGLLIIATAQHVLILKLLGQTTQIFHASEFLRLNQIAVAAVVLFGLLSVLSIWLGPL